MPTLSIGYSLKARGINRDVYGHLDHCLSIADLTPAVFAERLQALFATEWAIRTHLAVRIPEIQSKALSAGARLREVLGHSACT